MGAGGDNERADAEATQSGTVPMCPIDLPGLCSILNGPDISCRLVGLSSVEAHVRTVAAPPVGAWVVIACPGLGLLGGHVSDRSCDEIFIVLEKADDQAARLTRFLAMREAIAKKFP